MLKLAIAALALLMLIPTAQARGRGGSGGCCVLVQGYVKSNGTYVQPYLRSSPGAESYRGNNSQGLSLPTLGVATDNQNSNYRADGEAAGSCTPEMHKIVSGPSPVCAGQKLYGTGVGVCVFGGQD